MGSTPLHIAVSVGDMDVVTTLVSNGADMKQLNYHEQTVLHVAAQDD